MQFSLLLVLAGCLVTAVLGQSKPSTTKSWKTEDPSATGSHDHHDHGHTTDDPHGEPTYEPHGEPTYEPHGEPTREPHGEPHGEPYGEPNGEPNMNPCAYWMGQCKMMYERSMESVRDLEMWDRCVGDVYSCMNQEEKKQQEMMSRYIKDMIRWKRMDDGEEDWGNHSSLFLPSVFLLTTCMAVANWLKLY